MDRLAPKLSTFITVACLVYGLQFGCNAQETFNCTISSGCNVNCSDITERFRNISTISDPCSSSRDKDCRCAKKHYQLLAEFKGYNITTHTTVSVIVTFYCTSDDDIAKYMKTKEINALGLSNNTEFKNISTGNKGGSIDVAGGTVHVNANTTAIMTSTTTSNREVEVLEETNSFNKHLLGDPGRLIVVATEGSSNNSNEVLLRIENRNPPLSFLKDSIRVLDVSKLCGIFDINLQKWDSSACILINSTATETTCQCEHNSMFGVIFAVREVHVNEHLSTVSTVLEIVSMACLVLSAFLLGFYRQRMRNFDRVLVQICLCTALFLFHLFIIASPLAVRNEKGCLAVAVTAHYFLTTTAVLMVMEGMLMLTKVLAPNFFSSASSNSKRRRGIGFSVAWIVPLLYAGGCATYGIITHGKDYADWSDDKGYHQSCWINYRYWYLVVIPVAVSLFINTCIAIRLGVLVWTMSKSAEEFKPSNQRDVNKASHSGKAFRAVVILMPILGIPWIIGFLVNINKLELVFMSMHVVVNGLQGVLLLCHYVIFNSEMRACMKRSWKTAMSNFGSLATPTVQFTSKRSESTLGLHDG